MCDYIKLQKAKGDLLNTLDLLLKDAEDNFEKESSAATYIQRVFRGTWVRQRIATMTAACCHIERVYRGHLGRTIARNALQRRRDGMQIAIFEYFSLQIQKMFRGYYSRKYRKNHANRKKYLLEVTQKGEEVRKMLQDYATAQEIREEDERQMAAKKEFQHIAENLHHLVGTKHVRGVFNPLPQYMETPTVAGQPIEDHLRFAVKDLLRTRGITKTGLMVDLNGSRKVPLKGMKNKLSLQASAPFDVLDQQKTRERILHKILTLDPKNSFFAGGRPKALGSHRTETVPLCVGDPFMDAWANPLLVRGVPVDQQQLNDSMNSRKSLFAKVPDKPYYVAVGGNKSTVLPNGLFDVIAEAEVAGGGTKRPQGTTRRFGLPDNVDNRPKDGTLPQPPTRATAVRLNIKRSYRIQTKSIGRFGTNKKGTASYEDINPSSDEEENKDDESM